MSTVLFDEEPISFVLVERSFKAVTVLERESVAVDIGIVVDSCEIVDVDIDSCESSAVDVGISLPLLLVWLEVTAAVD